MWGTSRLRGRVPGLGTIQPHGFSDYRVVKTPDGCLLTWVMAMKPNGVAARIGMTLGRPVMARMFQKFLYNLRDYTDTRFAAAG
jgi:hypothetical protein